MKSIYFSNKKGFGNIAPTEGMTALRDKITAESVAWVCIAVQISFFYFYFY
jgi:hypothetical protein